MKLKTLIVVKIKQRNYFSFQLKSSSNIRYTAMAANCWRRQRNSRPR